MKERAGEGYRVNELGVGAALPLLPLLPLLLLQRSVA
jgi:hypothetical protein